MICSTPQELSEAYVREQRAFNDWWDSRPDGYDKHNEPPHMAAAAAWFARSVLSERGDSTDKRDAARWRFIEHGCQWVGFTPSGGDMHSFDPRIVSGYAGHLQDMRATVDAETAKQIAMLKEGAENLKRSLE